MASSHTTTAQPLASSSLIQDYKNAKNRLILLDYDGTLVSFVDNPSDAQPSATLVQLVHTLAQNTAQNTVAIVSGRDKDTLYEWWKPCVPPLSLVAEHGAWSTTTTTTNTSSSSSSTTTTWTPCRDDLETVTAQWKSLALPVLQDYCDRTPGASIETKQFSLVWHCRQVSDPALAEQRMTELQHVLQHDILKELTTRSVVGVHVGARIVELKNTGVDKGAAVARMLTSSSSYDFVYMAGDDYTDEDMFAQTQQLNNNNTTKVYTVKVGDAPDTCARYRVPNVAAHTEWLTRLVQAEEEQAS